MAAESRFLVLYDGECGLCDRTVQWLLKRDRKNVLRYAPLGGETAKRFVKQQGPVDTLVLVEELQGQALLFRRSRAMFRILSQLGGIWRVVAWLRFLPQFFTDAGYRLIAHYRIAWFGRIDACRVPDASVRDRFLP